jgi:hypothetical protein
MDVYVYVYVYSTFVFSCVGRGLAMSSSLVQGVLPTGLDKETEVKRGVSCMPHAPMGAKKGIIKKVGSKLHWNPNFVSRFRGVMTTMTWKYKDGHSYNKDIGKSIRVTI